MKLPQLPVITFDSPILRDYFGWDASLDIRFVDQCAFRCNRFLSRLPRTDPGSLLLLLAHGRRSFDLFLWVQFFQPR